MPWSASGVSRSYLDDILDGVTAIDLDGDTLKAALYDDDITPDATAASALFAYNAGQWAIAGNEVSDGTEWDAGGEPITGAGTTGAASTTTFDAVDTPSGGSSATLTNVFGCFVYSDTVTTPVADQGVCFNYFGGVNSVADGTFTIIWAGTGIFTIAV